MSKHTPGPWTAFIPKTDVTNPSVKGADGITFAEMGGFGQDRKTNEANAHLIAAAPDLYKALKKCVERLQHYENNLGNERDVLNAAETAIAKARDEK